MMTQPATHAPVWDARVAWTLRSGACMCFVGHGAFGVMTRAAWVPYFGVVGISPHTAYALMPFVGALDIAMGCIILVSPRPVVAYWMLGWAIWTALLRPLSGESAWEAVERAGNYGAAAALLLLMVPATSWRVRVARASFQHDLKAVPPALRPMLTLMTAMLLIGHGALSIGEKASIVHNLGALMPASTATALAPRLGWLEIGLGLLVVLRPAVPLLVAVVLWKIATEGLFLAVGAPAWEFIERGGSYTVPLALALLLVAASRARAPTA